MKNKRISKILGWGLTTGLIFASLAAVFASPAAAGEMEWTLENTPSWDDMVILPASDILDYDIGGDGDIIYTILEVDESCVDVGDDDNKYDFALVKSTDGGVSWSDITGNVTGATNLPEAFSSLVAVAVAPDDEDWVAVVGYDVTDDQDLTDGDVMVVASQDGGSNFSYAGDIIDGGYDEGDGSMMDVVFDMDVSMEINDIHNIALAGINYHIIDATSFGTVFRLKAGTWLTGSWIDTSDTNIASTDYEGWMATDAVIACEFSPNFDLDDSIVCLTWGDTMGGESAYMQSGIWETNGDWNTEGGFTGAVEIDADGEELQAVAYMRSMGLALPADYDGADPNMRAVFVYVNAHNTVTYLVGGFIFRIDNGSLGEVIGPSGDPLLSSIDVNGDADTGKVMIGEYFRVDNDGFGADADSNGDDDPAPMEACPCESVRVWHTEELDFCCPQWEPACKDPSGPYMALVMYVPDGMKAYATTSGTMDDDFFNDYTGLYPEMPCDPDNGIPLNSGVIGTPLDESAFSVSVDEEVGVSFNQLSLIDTDIDYLSDVAICPDCSVIYLSTINNEYDGNEPGDAEGRFPCNSEGSGDNEFGYFNCDSVWRSYDNGDTWERVFHGNWVDDGSGWRGNDELLLRLPCDTDEECCTLYLGVKNQDNGGSMAPDLTQVFYTRDCGQCWNETPDTKIDIQDIAIESENIVYVINDVGEFSMSTQYGRRWTDAVDTGLDTGHTIISCCREGFIVIGGDSGDPVAWSDDGGESWNTTDDVPGGDAAEEVHIACDPECQDIIYAAVDGVGIYRGDLTDGSWSDLNAQPIDYAGIVVARTGGTLYAVSDEIRSKPDEICPDRFDWTGGSSDGWYTSSGVARNLDPCETACCGTEDWDYLICGLDTELWSGDPDENFDVWTSALRICGCLSMDSNSILWAIDIEEYDVVDGSGDNDEWGGLWSYEDCAAKQGITLMSPADGDVIDCDPCASCEGAPFTLKWERMCNACSYDIQIMDEEGNVIVEWIDEEITGNPPSLYVDELGIQCGNTYTWHVRMANTDCECVHSPWSETWSFTIAVGAFDAIKLLSPANGDSGISTMGVGFSWTSVPDADSYQFVLAPNADLTGAMVSETTSDTAYSFTGSLDNETVYYWQVKAFKGDVLLTTSSTGVFTTALAPEEPQDPVVVQVPPDQIIEIPPAEQITPTWIYAVIGIGAALIVVVIVLIVRTRRP